MKRECTPPPHAHINLLAIQPGSGGKRQRGGGAACGCVCFCSFCPRDTHASFRDRGRASFEGRRTFVLPSPPLALGSPQRAKGQGGGRAGRVQRTAGFIDASLIKPPPPLHVCACHQSNNRFGFAQC